MQMVRLISNRKETIPGITINDQWQSYQGQPNGILFNIWVKSKDFCQTMIEDVKTDPTTFLDLTKLYFEFTMVVEQHASHVVNITGNMVMKSDFFAELSNKYSDKNGYVYLQSDDANKLAQDIYRNTIIHDVTSDNYISSKDENEIIKELLNEIKGDQVLLSQLSVNDSASVFWRDEFSKPDMQNNYLNDILTFDSDKKHFKYEEVNDQNFMGDLESRYDKETIKEKQAKTGFFYGVIGGNAGAQSRTGNVESNEFINRTQVGNYTYINKDNLLNFLDINKAMVKWTGEKFEPKDLALQRINTKLMQSKSEIFYKKVITSKLATTQELPLQVEPKFITNYSNSASPVFYEALQEAINKTDDRISRLVNENAKEIQRVFYTVTSHLHNEKLTKDAQIKETYDNLIAKLEEKAQQITSEANSIRALANENRGLINNHYQHHENRDNHIWGEIESIKNLLTQVRKDLGYACYMASKCHADRLSSALF